MTTDSNTLSIAIKDIQDGKIINVVDASSYRDGLCIGDFRSIGWSNRCADRKGMWYEWNGPNPISVSGKVVRPGGSTEYVEMDWS